MSGAGKRCVLSAVVRAGFPWGVFVAALSGPIYFNPHAATYRRMPVVAAVVWAAVSIGVVFFPITRYGEWAARRVLANGDSQRLANVASALAIAIGVPTERVAVLDTPIPDVGVFPTRHGNVVVATAGAVNGMSRAELETLVASQLTAASDRWVRIATSAQLVQSPRMALLFTSVFVNPAFMPFAFLAFYGGRYADAARDLVADEMAVRTTSNPDALSNAFASLGALAAQGSRLKVGLFGFLSDQFWVMSTRLVTTTTVTAGNTARSWTTVDEIALEMRLRSERAAQAMRGDWSGFRGLRAWKRGLRHLGERGASA